MYVKVAQATVGLQGHCEASLWAMDLISSWPGAERSRARRCLGL